MQLPVTYKIIKITTKAEHFFNIPNQMNVESLSFNTGKKIQISLADGVIKFE